MKKALSMLMTLVMIVGFGSFTLTGAAAKTVEDSQQGAWLQWSHGNGDIHKVAKMLNQKGQPVADDPKEKEVIVRFADPDSANMSAAEEKTIGTIHTMALNDTGSKGSKKIELADGITVSSDEVWAFGDSSEGDSVTVAVASSKTLSTEKMIKRLQSQDMIEAVSPNYRRHICADSDPYRAYQWALDPSPGISVDAEWNGESQNTGSRDNIVAVIDTGIDYEHEDFQHEQGCQMWENTHGNKLKGTYGFDFANGDIDPMDDNGHGTHCAGIIGAATNGCGMQGVNQQVSLMALKVLDAEGGGYDSDIIAAFNYVYRAMDLGENIVAINCSFGGEDADPIMEDVIDKIGAFEEKDKSGKVIRTGAVTVCAAGNEAMDCDEEPSYPACFDSEYIISVAATKSVPDAEDPSKVKAELVSFSNYGKDSVDIAAPGTDILSTVSYDCFNPTLYGNDSSIVRTYLAGAASDINQFTLTNMDLTDPGVISSDPAAGFFSGEGLKIRFTAPSDDKKKWQYVAIPYTLPDDYQEGNVDHSLMIKTMDGPKELTFDDYLDGTFSKVLILDVPQSLLEDPDFLNKPGEDILFDHAYDYQIVAGDDDYWSHMRTSMIAETEDGRYVINNTAEEAESIDPVKDADKISKDRALLILGDSQAGDFTAYIDDVGVSQCTTDSSIYGQYDFYSGTSMATPYVAGVAALTKAANLNKEDYGPEMLIGDIMSMANDEPPLTVDKKAAVGADGAVDFAKKGTGLWVGISAVTVDTAKKQVKLKGRFDDGNVDLTIKKSSQQEGEAVPEESFISRSSQEIVLKEDGLINNVVDITVSRTKDGKTKTSTKQDVYVVKGKKNYSVFAEGESGILADSAITTDGSRIYAAQSVGDSIQYMLNKKGFSSDELAVFTKSFIKKNFDMAKKMSKTAQYDFRFGDDLVKIGKFLYVKGSFCEVTEGGWSDDEDWSKGKSSREDDSQDDGDRFSDYYGAAYAEEPYIFRINTSTGKITRLAWPNNSASLLTDSKLASYNGSLYLLGGINESSNVFSDKVYCYNASGNKWTQKAKLPQGRAGGKVLQTGNTLVYTLGYTAENEDSLQTPVNYIFNGSKWTKKTERLTPIDPEETEISRGNKKYCSVSGNVGICKVGSAYGLVYIGLPVESYGDTFTYNVSKDVYTKTDFNYTKNLSDVYDLYAGEIKLGALAIGDRIIGCDAESNIVGINKAVSSGLIRITGTLKNGKINGKSKYTGSCMPGTSCTIKATANPGYYVKSLKFAGKSGKAMARGMKASAVLTRDITATATTAKVTVASVKSLTLKEGKSASLKAKIKQAAAAKQWKLAYKSSNKKYATVNAAGKVTAKKAGKGKTVKIQIKLKGTNKVMKTVKVKIKN